MRPILTDNRGTAFDRPEPPARDAGATAWVDYIRALHDYNDKISDIGNRAFDRAFRKAIRS